jgi:uncharacterized protein YyaL (SSP411 family)
VDDYANLCRAAVALYEATFSGRYLDQARVWITVLDRHHWDNAGGGYFFAADDTEALIARAKTAADAAVPAGNGTMVGVLTRLALLTGEDAYRQRADAVIQTFAGEMGRNFFPLATLMNNAELAQKAVQIVIAGADGSVPAELHRAVYRVSSPNRIVAFVPAGSVLPSGHPAQGKGPLGSKPAAYVCEGPVCSLPLTDAAQLIARLDNPD